LKEDLRRKVAILKLQIIRQNFKDFLIFLVFLENFSRV